MSVEFIKVTVTGQRLTLCPDDNATRTEGERTLTDRGNKSTLNGPKGEFPPLVADTSDMSHDEDLSFVTHLALSAMCPHRGNSRQLNLR